MENHRGRNTKLEAEDGNARAGWVIQAISRLWTRTWRYIMRRRIRWEVTAARLDDQTQKNLSKWAKIMLASGEEPDSQARVLVVLQDEEQDLVTNIEAVAEGRASIAQ